MAAKMAAIFIENACTPLKTAKTCFSFGFWLPFLLIKENRYKYTHNALLPWPNIKFLCHWPEKGPDFVQILRKISPWVSHFPALSARICGFLLESF